MPRPFVAARPAILTLPVTAWAETPADPYLWLEEIDGARPQFGALAGKIRVSRGGVLVLSNIPGGSEFGPRWQLGAIGRSKRYTKLGAGASWVAEYGDPDTAVWNYMSKWSPYRNLHKGAANQNQLVHRIALEYTFFARELMGPAPR